jgi:hypoxanthine phosphoribosyltransferase
MRIEPLIEEDVLRARVRELADRLWRDYADSPLTVLCILEGARRFTDDLLRHLAERGLVPERIDVRAHRTEGTTLGPVTIEHFDPDVLEGRDVLVVDDLADEGVTLRGILDIAALGEPRSRRVCVLLDKVSRRTEEVPLDYVGFPIENVWVIGYGMDVDGEYRELDWIGVLKDDRF